MFFHIWFALFDMHDDHGHGPRHLTLCLIGIIYLH